MRLIPTILCGGAGSRLWPVSRKLHPKPFIRMSDGHSLYQKAFLRGAQLPGVKEILTVTNQELFFKIEDEIREVNQSHITPSFILEPFGRNTAAAIAATALYIQELYDAQTLLLILAADHVILNQDAFQTAVFKATELASANNLVTFGIPPDRPHTGYGYMEAEGHKVIRFIEKPSLEKAQEYLATDQFLWNSGMFLFTAGTLLQAMEKACPDILSSVKNCLTHSRYIENKGSKRIELDAQSFEQVPENSIDYAVMEKSEQVSVVACDIAWSDMGSWNAFDDLTIPDAKGNRVEGNALLHEVTDCYIRSEERLVGAVGVDNLIVIDTPDALLVAHKSCVQDVKHIYSQLKQQDHEAHKLHRTVHRPWGTYTVLEESQYFKIKRIEVKPGASLSLQMHHHRSEHWIVVQGLAQVTNNDKEFFVNVNESTYIPAGHRHRLENPGMITLVMIEVQSGEYLGEDDIVRFDDKYGRA